MIKIILFYFLYTKRLVLDTKILPFLKYLTASSRQIHCEGKFAMSCHMHMHWKELPVTNNRVTINKPK